MLPLVIYSDWQTINVKRGLQSEPACETRYSYQDSGSPDLPKLYQLQSNYRELQLHSFQYTLKTDLLFLKENQLLFVIPYPHMLGYGGMFFQIQPQRNSAYIKTFSAGSFFYFFSNHFFLQKCTCSLFHVYITKSIFLLEC